MGNIPSRNEAEKQQDILFVDNLVRSIGDQKSVTWKPSFEVSECDYSHIINILQKYHPNFKIEWSDNNCNEGNGYVFKKGEFDGKSLPSIRNGAVFSRSGEYVEGTYKIYPSNYTFYKRDNVNVLMPHLEPDIPLSNNNNIYVQPPVSAPPVRDLYDQPAHNPYMESPNAPADNYSYVEWKTQEYKAELTAEGSYLMYERTHNDKYSEQAGAWKTIKNLAQDQKVSKQEFIAKRDVLYKPPYNLPIHDDIKDCAKYKVLRTWILRDGVQSDKQKILEKYPQFYTFQQYEQYCQNNSGLMPQMLAYLNEISCSIQKEKEKQQSNNPMGYSFYKG